MFAFEQLRGSQVVANFWATWCAPCVEEMPELSALATELQGTGTRFVGVGVDNQDAIARFSARLPVSYPLVVANATGAFLAGRFGNNAGGLPLYGGHQPRDGRVKQQILGRVRIDSLREVLKSQICVDRPTTWPHLQAFPRSSSSTARTSTCWGRVSLRSTEVPRLRRSISGWRSSRRRPGCAWNASRAIMKER